MYDDSVISPFLWFIGMGAVFGIASAHNLLRGATNDHLFTRGAIFFFGATALSAENWFQACAYALCPVGALHIGKTAMLWIAEHYASPNPTAATATAVEDDAVPSRKPAPLGPRLFIVFGLLAAAVVFFHYANQPPEILEAPAEEATTEAPDEQGGTAVEAAAEPTMAMPPSIDTDRYLAPRAYDQPDAYAAEPAFDTEAYKRQFRQNITPRGLSAEDQADVDRTVNYLKDRNRRDRVHGPALLALTHQASQSRRN